MSDSGQSLTASLLATLGTGSSAVLTGIPLAVPGAALVWYLDFSQVGYYLIGFLAAATHATLRRLSENRDRPADLSEHSRGEQYTILIVFSILAALSVSTRLLAGVLGAVVASGFLGQGVPVVVAVVIPLVDLRLADVDPRLSPSGAVGLVVLSVVRHSKGTWFESDSAVRKIFEPKQGRFGPV